MKCLELKEESPRLCLLSAYWCGLSVLWAGLTGSGWAQQFPPDFLCSSRGTSGERPKDFSARVCTWHRGAGSAVIGPAVPPVLKSHFFWSLFCYAHLNLGGGKKILVDLFHPLPCTPRPLAPSLARCSLLAPAHNSFLGGCCQSYSILPGTQKGYFEPTLNILEYESPAIAWYSLMWFVSWKEQVISPSGRKTCRLLLHRGCTLSPASWSPWGTSLSLPAPTIF